MRLRHASLACALLAAGCGKVSSGADGGGNDHRDDGGGSGVVADAAPLDAAPVACDSPEDCAHPDDPCLLPGTCEDRVCHFEAMDCSDLDGECTKGICSDGECRPKSIREGQGCGTGVMACGAFDDCGGFADICDESGSQGRSCTDSTCQAGTCVTGSPYVDTRNCARSTEGVTCADTAVDCDSCDYPGECAREAPPVNCVQTDYSCASGGCTPSQTGFQQDICHRDVEGGSCDNGNGCCTPTGACAPSCV
jgi:hypothetical protein